VEVRVTVAFPKTASFTGAARPFRAECDLFELEYDGEIPPALDGALYRCGPDPQLPPKLADDVFINGDGQVSMFRFENGHVDFRMRYVRTEKFTRERAARRALFGAYRNPFTDDPSVAGADRTTANTSIVWHAGRMFACKEDGLPCELDPLTLETRGKWNFGRRLKSKTFTAHPKNDPVTGEMVFYGYAVEGEASRRVAFCIADAQGNLAREDWFTPPYASMIHDFAVTDRHAIFPIMPVTSDPDRLRVGGDHWAWDDSKPTYVGILPRDGSVTDIRYFEGPPCWSFHTMNAMSEGDKVYLDLTVSDVISFPFRDVHGKPIDPSRSRASYLTRWTFDLAANTTAFTQSRLWNRPADFFDVDPRFLTRGYAHGFMAAKSGDGPFDTIAHINHRSGEVATYKVPPGATVQEPTFVPRSPGAPEGDGFLMFVVNWPQERVADLVILDTADLTRGPIASVHLPIPLRMAFHNKYISGAELAQRAQP
jgi:carotenoid cleavage dioxygenase-like enzyme